jgi:hypothetical protein
MIFIHIINIMTDNPKKMYGWFSEKAQAVCNSIVTYDTPKNGTVQVTNITDSSTDSKMEWDDCVCLGEVTKFISNKPSNKYSNKFHTN